MNTISPDNYLKSIYHLQQHEGEVLTTDLARSLNMRPPSVTEMLLRLQHQGLVKYRKYYGARLTSSGRRRALDIIRRHRLWEYFLAEKLGIGWDCVHDIAEQLEHVESELLTEKLDLYLGRPRFDPHGDPIPDKQGRMNEHTQAIRANKLQAGDRATIVGLEKTTDTFLKHLDTLNLRPGSFFKVKSLAEFDGTLTIITGRYQRALSAQVAQHLLVVKQK